MWRLLSSRPLANAFENLLAMCPGISPGHTDTAYAFRCVSATALLPVAGHAELTIIG